MESENGMEPPYSPVTSRPSYMQYRKSTTMHPMTKLTKWAQQQNQNAPPNNGEKHDDPNLSTESYDAVFGTPSQPISDDSGIDLTQDDSNVSEGRRYSMRNRNKDPF